MKTVHKSTDSQAQQKRQGPAPVHLSVDSVDAMQHSCCIEEQWPMNAMDLIERVPVPDVAERISMYRHLVQVQSQHMY